VVHTHCHNSKATNSTRPSSQWPVPVAAKTPFKPMHRTYVCRQGCADDEGGRVADHGGSAANVAHEGLGAGRVGVWGMVEGVKLSDEASLYH